MDVRIAREAGLDRLERNTGGGERLRTVRAREEAALVALRLGLDADSFSPAGLDAGKGLELLLEAGRQMKLNAA